MHSRILPVWSRVNCAGSCTGNTKRRKKAPPIRILSFAASAKCRTRFLSCDSISEMRHPDLLLQIAKTQMDELANPLCDGGIYYQKWQINSRKKLAPKYASLFTVRRVISPVFVQLHRGKCDASTAQEKDLKSVTEPPDDDRSDKDRATSTNRHGRALASYR